MSLTFSDLLNRLRHVDEFSLLELLEIDSDDLVKRFQDKIEFKIDQLFEEFEEELPFNATPHDSMPYGVELFNRAIAGEFGPIIDFDVAHPGVREALANTASQPQPTVQGAQTL